MDDPIKERLRLKYLKARKSYVVKTRPIKDAEYLERIHELAVERLSEAGTIWTEYNERLRPVLDGFGITGSVRLMYYNFGRELLSYCLNFSENLWHNYVEGLRTHYLVSYKLDPECLDRIIELTTAFAREIRGGPEVGEGGGKEA